MFERFKVPILSASATLVVIALFMGAMRFYSYWQDLEARAAIASHPAEPTPPVASSSSLHLSVKDQFVPQAALPDPPKQPQFALAPIFDQGFVLNPSQGWWISIGPEPYQGRSFHVHLRSASPVDMGVLATFGLNPNVNLSRLGNLSLCHQPRVTRVDFDCVIPPDRQIGGLDLSFVLHDSRSGPGALASMGAALLGSRTALDNESVRNDVTLTLSERRCVANCN